MELPTNRDVRRCGDMLRTLAISVFVEIAAEPPITLDEFVKIYDQFELPSPPAGSKCVICSWFKQGEKIKRIIPCLLQVHIAQEETKFGFDAEGVLLLIENNQLKHFPFVGVVGLMGMATLTNNTDQIRKEFRSLKNLFDQLKNENSANNFKELSMGMTADYKIALEEGSTLIRVGTAIFGDRNYAPL